MKIKSTITALSLLIFGFFLMNNAAGPAEVQGQDRTGSPLSTGSCNTAGCHASGAFDPSVSVKVMSGGDAISGYEPGASYTLEITIAAGTGTPSEYGFQAVALDGNNENGGSFPGIPNGGQQLVTFSNGVEYMEHSEPATSNVFTTSLWEAPAAGSGDITFYVGAIAADDNGNSGSDGGATATITLTEGFMTSSTEVAQSIGFTVFPNPAQDFVTLNINSQVTGEAQLQLLDVTGKVLQTEAVGIQQGENAQRVEIGHLNSGLYLMHLVYDDQVITERVVKM